MIPVTLFTDDLRIELTEAYIDPWSYRSPYNHELLDIEVMEEDVSQLVRILGLYREGDRRILVASMGYPPTVLTTAEVRLESHGRVVVTVGDAETIEMLKAFRVPLTLEGESQSRDDR